MSIGVQTATIALISLLGAACQAVVTVRWYEPPARDGRTPEPRLEAGIFFVTFAILFALLGLLVSFVAGLAPPYGRSATLLLTPVGVYAAYTNYTGSTDTGDQATRFMSVVGSLVLAVYPVVLFAA